MRMNPSRVSLMRPGLVRLFLRPISNSCSVHQNKKGVILGVYSHHEKNSTIEGTKTYEKYNSYLSGKLNDLYSLTSPLKPGNARVYFGNEKCSIISVVSLGEKNPEMYHERRDVAQENIRAAIAGIKSFKGLGIKNVEVDVANNPVAAAEGAYLAAWKYKNSERLKYPAVFSPIKTLPDQDSQIYENDPSPDWQEGKVLAESQNFARFLMDSPANLMTPTAFAETVKVKLEMCGTKGRIQVIVRDKEWIEEQNMRSFLSVAKGSNESPKFLEIHYTGHESSSDHPPLIFVGKGVTFDSGGISIKPSKGMDAMRGDMGGAANVSSAIYAAARLNTQGRVIGLIPLCENMPNGKANKPGDVVTAKDGTTIQVDNTDAEGRLILADALCYAREFEPSAIVDLATLTGAMVVALGGGAAGVFTNSSSIWDKLEKASHATGDRLWRMPIFRTYTDQIRPSYLADINNVGKEERSAGSCTAAMFLNHFIKKGTPWAHIDIAGVMDSSAGMPYLCEGMSGRPTRTLTRFIQNYFE